MYFSIAPRAIYSIVGSSHYVFMKGAPDAPAPPDPYATAAAQTGMNKETAEYQQALNLINQSTPTGSITYSQIPGTEGEPQRWQSTTTLTPEAQKAFDLQQQAATSLSQLALQGTEQIGENLNTPLNLRRAPSVSSLSLSPFDPSSLPSGPSTLDLSSLGQLPEGLDLTGLGDVPQFDESARQRAEDALYGLNTARLDPQYQIDRTNLENRLINSGIQKGTPLYDQQIAEFERNKEYAYRQARDQSIAGSVDYGSELFGTQLAGRQQAVSERGQVLATKAALRSQGMSELEATRRAEAEYADRVAQRLLSGGQLQVTREQAKAGQDLAARQQYINEQAYLRNLPINEVAALLGTGSIAMPSFGAPPATSVANTDLSGMVYNSAALNQQAWQQEMQNRASILGGLFSLGGSALGGWARSGFA